MLLLSRRLHAAAPLLQSSADVIRLLPVMAPPLATCVESALWLAALRPPPLVILRLAHGDVEWAAAHGPSCAARSSLDLAPLVHLRARELRDRSGKSVGPRVALGAQRSGRKPNTFLNCQFGPVVQTFDRAARDLFSGVEVIQDDLAMRSVVAIFFIGRMRERMTGWRQSSRNLPT